MVETLRILILEDIATDAELAVRELRRAGLVVASLRVETEAGFVRALTEFAPDLILADYSLPQFDGLSAVKIVQAQCPRVPVIIVSAALGEEQAIESLKLGATDYVLKQRLERLGPVAKRALLEAAERRQRQRAEDQIRYLAGVLENVSDGVISTEINGNILSWNSGAEAMFGYRAEEVLGRPYTEVIAYDYLEGSEPDPNQPVPESGRWKGELRVRRKDGTPMYILVAGAVLKDHVGTATGFSAVLHDITERKQAEVALIESMAQFRTLFEVSPDAIMLIDPTGDWPILDCNPAAGLMNGYTRDELIGQSVDLLNLTTGSPAERRQYLERLRLTSVIRLETLHRRKDATIVPIEVSTSLITLKGREVVLGIDRDITERKRAEAGVFKSERRYRSLFENMIDGYAYCHMLFDGQEALDFIILECNQAFGQLTGLGDVIGLRVTEAIPGIRASNPEMFATYGRVALSGLPEKMELYAEPLHRWFSVAVYSPEKEYFVSIFENITERKAAQAQVEFQAHLLAHISDAIVATDKEFRINAWNHAAEALYGWAAAEVMGRGVDEVLRSEFSPPEEAQALRQLREFGSARLDVVQRHKDGRPVVIEGLTIALKDAQGVVTGYVSANRDIAERVQRERELLAIAAISAALRAANTQAEMLPIALQQVTLLLNADAAALAMRDPATDELVVALGQGEMADLAGRRLPAGAGIAGQALASRQPYVTADIAADPHFHQLKSLGEARAAICAPLITSSQALGVLWAKRAMPFSDVEVRVLSAMAGIVASAIQRAGLYEQTEQRLRRLTALREIDNAIMNSLDLPTTLTILLSHVTVQLGVDAGDVLLLSRGLNALEFAAGRGFRSKAIEKASMRLGEGHAGQAALERRLVEEPDLRSPHRVFRRAALLAMEEFVAMVCVPLVAKGQVVGVLEVFHRAPLDPDSDWLAFLETLAGQAAIAIADSWLFSDLQRSNMELLLAYDTTLEGWSAALDLRDKETEGHSQRVTEMTLRLARTLAVGEGDLEQMRRGALLHDIGKMGVPDSILLKPGKLTDSEWAVMRQHPRLAYVLLSPIAYLRPALDIPYCHHEKWDGSGYPRQLKGEEIPLSARIFAVVDVWDALRSDRPYRSGWAEETVRAYIRDEAGKHFDPQVAAAFLALRPPSAA